MYGIKGIDHIARDGLLAKVLAGSYPSGPSSMPSPAIWEMITPTASRLQRALGHPVRPDPRGGGQAPGRADQGGPGHLRRSGAAGLRHERQGAAEPIVRKVEFAGDAWLFFPTIVPDVAIIRATTADERGNLTYEHEGAYLGRSTRRWRSATTAASSSRRSSGWPRPARSSRSRSRAGRAGRRDRGRPEMQPTQTAYDPAISGEYVPPELAHALGRRQGDRAPGRRSCAPAGRSISASASRPTCRACCSRRAATATSPG